MNIKQPAPKLQTGLGVQERKLFISTHPESKFDSHNDDHSSHRGGPERQRPSPQQIANMAAELEEKMFDCYSHIDRSVIRSLVESNINNLERHVGHQLLTTDPNSPSRLSPFPSGQAEGISLFFSWLIL